MCYRDEMDKGYIIGATFAYAVFILLTAWLIMIGLGMLGVSVPFIGVTTLVIAARFAYVLVKGPNFSE
jgi:hypothetical protein